MKTLLALALTLSAALPVLAAETQAVTPSDISKVQSLDEVVVQGDRESLTGARTALVEAEDRFYARFNELNDDDQYDIKCHYETPRDHHSRISTRVCLPRFVEEPLGEEVARMQDFNGIYIAPSVDNRKSARTIELQKKTLQLIRSDPALMRALLERARLEEHYQALRKEKFKDKRVAWD